MFSSRQSCLLMRGKTRSLGVVRGKVKIRSRFDGTGCDRFVVERIRKKSPKMWNICFVAIVLTSLFSESSANPLKDKDLILLIDRSNRTKIEYEDLLDFIKKLPMRFPINRYEMYVAIVTFSTHAEVVLPMSKEENVFQEAIDQMRERGTDGNTATQEGLKRVKEEAMEDDQRAKVLLIITDGCTNPFPDGTGDLGERKAAQKEAEEWARKLRDEDDVEIYLIHIAIAECPEDHQLKLTGSKDRIVKLDNFDQLVDPPVLDKFFGKLTTTTANPEPPGTEPQSESMAVEPTNSNEGETDDEKHLGLYIAMALCGLLLVLILLALVVVVVVRKRGKKKSERRKMAAATGKKSDVGGPRSRGGLTSKTKPTTVSNVSRSTTMGTTTYGTPETSSMSKSSAPQCLDVKPGKRGPTAGTKTTRAKSHNNRANVKTKTRMNETLN